MHTLASLHQTKRNALEIFILSRLNFLGYLKTHYVNEMKHGNVSQVYKTECSFQEIRVQDNFSGKMEQRASFKGTLYHLIHAVYSSLIELKLRDTAKFTYLLNVIKK